MVTKMVATTRMLAALTSREMSAASTLREAARAIVKLAWSKVSTEPPSTWG